MDKDGEDTNSGYCLKMQAWICGFIGAGAVLCLAVTILVLYQLLRFTRRRYRQPTLLPCTRAKDSTAKSRGLDGLEDRGLVFSYQDLEEASEGFSNHIGEGTTNHVYKGILSDGSEVAIKRIKDEVFNSSDVEARFQYQVDLLTTIHHHHMVNLIGYCYEKHERMLVFQYCPNGTLFENLHGDDHIPWKQRMRIAVGAALGLCYLHHFVDPPLIHGDFRSRHIYLTEDFAAKISGLGHIPIAGSSELALVRKTGGYVDPEVVQKGVYSRSADVYSFGVLLLELMSGRVAFSENFGMLVEWASQFLHSRDRMVDLMDPTLKNLSPIELYSICEIARICVQREASSRPSMKEVVDMLVQTLGITAEMAAPHGSPVTLRGLLDDST